MGCIKNVTLAITKLTLRIDQLWVRLRQLSHRNSRLTNLNIFLLVYSQPHICWLLTRYCTWRSTVVIAWLTFETTCLCTQWVLYAIVSIIIAENASLNALNVSALDQQNLSKYNAGPCEWKPYKLAEASPTNLVILGTSPCSCHYSHKFDGLNGCTRGLHYTQCTLTSWH